MQESWPTEWAVVVRDQRIETILSYVMILCFFWYVPCDDSSCDPCTIEPIIVPYHDYSLNTILLIHSSLNYFAPKYSFLVNSLIWYCKEIHKTMYKNTLFFRFKYGMNFQRRIAIWDWGSIINRVWLKWNQWRTQEIHKDKD